MSYNNQGPVVRPLQDPKAEPERAHKPDKADECPECGADLSESGDRFRYKHAVTHYGDEPISRRADHRLAAERKAAILGVKVDEVLT